MIFVTGGTGYVGRPLIGALQSRGHTVRALVRRGSEHKLPLGTDIVPGDALDSSTWTSDVQGCDTFVHLVGTPHPNPSKAAEFERVDLASVRASVAAARVASVAHFVYVSVAHPAPVMHAYIAARSQGESAIRDAGLNATILRPWYVLGRGHWWPVMILPIYAIAGLFASKRATVARLGLVTHRQMLRALVHAVEHPVCGISVVEVPAIRRAMLSSSPAGVC